MSSDYYTSKKETLDFKTICLGHFKKILEITTSEFIGGYWNYIMSGNTTNKQYITNKRTEFCQSIESLANALFPHFDKQMKEDYENFLKKEKEINQKYSDEEGFLLNDETKKMKHSIQKLELMKELFRNLSCLMFRLDYFKGATYTEGDLDTELFDVDGRNTDD